MRVRTFDELTGEYSWPGRGFDNDDLAERKRLLDQGLCSVIIEADWMEFDNLEKWIGENIDEVAVES